MVAIFVILTIVAFIAVDSLVQWAEDRQQRPALQPARPPAVPLRPVFAFGEVLAPAGVFVDPGHTWVRLDATGRVTVGMDEFSERIIGRIDEVRLPEVGREVEKGETLFAIRQGDRTAEFSAPVDGVIRSVNSGLAHHPEAIKANPYEQGWICSLTPKNLAGNLRRLSIAEDAAAWLKNETRRFQEFIAGRSFEGPALGHVLQDGGQLTDGVREVMDDETWHLFASGFLRQPASRPPEIENN